MPLKEDSSSGSAVPGMGNDSRMMESGRQTVDGAWSGSEMMMNGTAVG